MAAAKPLLKHDPLEAPNLFDAEVSCAHPLAVSPVPTDPTLCLKASSLFRHHLQHLSSHVHLPSFQLLAIHPTFRARAAEGRLQRGLFIQLFHVTSPA